MLAIRADEHEAAGPAPPELLDLIDEAIVGTMRAVDVIVRTGQSRFEVVLPETDAEGARTLAERIRLRIDSTRPDPDSGISVSIGVASFPADGSDDIELSAAAVQALERAAELGGNRTVLYSLPEGAPRLGDEPLSSAQRTWRSRYHASAAATVSAEMPICTPISSAGRAWKIPNSTSWSAKTPQSTSAKRARASERKWYM